MGRPSKLNPGVQSTIVAHVLDFVPLDVAAAAAGITDRTLHYWMAQGEKEYDDWEGDEEPEPGTHASFFQSVRRARAQAQIKRIADAMKGDDRGESNGKAKCAQWALERRSKQFQPQIAVKVEHEMAMMIDVLAAVLPPEQYADVLGAIEDVDDEGIPRVLTAGPAESEAHTEH